MTCPVGVIKVKEILPRTPGPLHAPGVNPRSSDIIYNSFVTFGQIKGGICDKNRIKDSMKIFLSVILMVCCYLNGVNAVRIIGGIQLHYDREHELVANTGAFGRTHEKAEVKIASNHICITPEGVGYCLNVLWVIEDEDSEKKHQQIHGTQLDVFDAKVKLYCEKAKVITGDLSVGEKKMMSNGFVWNPCTEAFGYGMLYVYVELDKNPPMVSGISTRIYNREKPSETLQETFLTGEKDHYKDEPIEIAEFYVADGNIDAGSAFRKINMYRAKTVLKGFDAHFDKQNIIETHPHTLDSRSIVNDGCGTEYVSGMTGSYSTTKSITEMISATFSKSFEFGFEVSAEAKGDIGFASTTVGLSSSTNFGFGSDQTQEMSVTTTATYTWPKYCKPGTKLETNLLMVTETVEIPVTFKFERGDVEFKVKDKWTLKRSFSQETSSTTIIPENEHCG
ncbi:uncharacterized protein LOC141909251 [Tubulanus polymorphus]|uniref:uncharacterized protein LOC141909251 n=1 Tax=Tubulanus polymorphus TaxID=672921 RepID=UPI003DA6B2DE